MGKEDVNRIVIRAEVRFVTVRASGCVFRAVRPPPWRGGVFGKGNYYRISRKLTPLKLDPRVFITFDERGVNHVKSGGQDREIRQLPLIDRKTP